MDSDGGEEINEFDLVEDSGKEIAPLLICTSCALLSCKLPKTWKGCVFTSKEIISELNLNQTFTEVVFNEQLQVVSPLNNDGMEITMVQGLCKHKTSVMFLVKNKFMTTLLAGIPQSEDAFTLNVFLSNSCLRNAVREGIDRVIIDDTLLLTNCSTITATRPQNYSSKYFFIRSLAYLIKPKKIMTLTSTKLGINITNLCEEIDFDDVL